MRENQRTKRNPNSVDHGFLFDAIKTIDNGKKVYFSLFHHEETNFSSSYSIVRDKSYARLNRDNDRTDHF